jgi:hypothetical protein
MSAASTFPAEWGDQQNSGGCGGQLEVHSVSPRVISLHWVSKARQKRFISFQSQLR